jgi:hypothetical protein
MFYPVGFKIFSDGVPVDHPCLAPPRSSLILGDPAIYDLPGHVYIAASSLSRAKPSNASAIVLML